MGFNAYHAADKDDPRLPPYAQPQKVVHGGSEDLEVAKVLAEEALELKAYGPNTIAFVVEIASNEKVFVATGSGPIADKARALLADRQAKAAAVKAARVALTAAQAAAE